MVNSDANLRYLIAKLRLGRRRQHWAQLEAIEHLVNCLQVSCLQIEVSIVVSNWVKAQPPISPLAEFDLCNKLTNFVAKSSRQANPFNFR